MVNNLILVILLIIILIFYAGQNFGGAFAASFVYLTCAPLMVIGEQEINNSYPADRAVGGSNLYLLAQKTGKETAQLLFAAFRSQHGCGADRLFYRIFPEWNDEPPDIRDRLRR